MHVKGGVPVTITVEEFRDWIGADEVSADDDDIQEAIDAEAADQAIACAWPDDYPPNLRMALLRRVLRNLAMKRLPLAMATGDAESGGGLLPRYDPEVRRYERPYRKLPIG
jgi:hypothetical protein